MNTDLIRILGIIIICAIFGILLKNISPSFSPILSVLVSCCIISVCVAHVSPIIEYLSDISQTTSFGSYAGVLLKVCGIGILTKLCADTCRDAGENAYASKAEIVGKTAILLCTFPVIKFLFEQVKDFAN